MKTVEEMVSHLLGRRVFQQPDGVIGQQLAE
jgi:hypothetical protein